MAYYGSLSGDSLIKSEVRVSKSRGPAYENVLSFHRIDIAPQNSRLSSGLVSDLIGPMNFEMHMYGIARQNSMNFLCHSSRKLSICDTGA